MHVFCVDADSEAQRIVVNTALDTDWSVFAADLDGDGDADVLSLSASENVISWYENFGGGVFGPQRIITNSTVGPHSVCVADMDGDGDLDILAACLVEETIIVWFENLGNGVFASEEIIIVAPGFCESMVAVDVDGDGDVDVLYSSSDDDHSGTIAWYENLGRGVFGSQHFVATSLTSFWSVVAADLNGDGDVDILSRITNETHTTIAWVENDGDGTFYDVHVLAEVLISVFSDSLFDGEPLFNGGIDAWIEQHSGPVDAADMAELIEIRDSIVSDEIWSVFAVDMDGDGDIDVVTASFDDTIAWYENLGAGVFRPQQVVVNTTDGIWAVFTADMDDDGDLDILTASWGGDPAINWFENLGVGRFDEKQLITGAVDYPESVFAVDLDGDGDPDILAPYLPDHDTWPACWFKNLGNGVFGAKRLIPSLETSISIDLDNNGNSLPALLQPLNENMVDLVKSIGE